MSTTNEGGSGDYKIKLHLAAQELVGAGTITERLSRAAWEFAHLDEGDFPAAICDRMMALKKELGERRGLLGDDPKSITDEDAAKLAAEFFALFAIAADPAYFGRILGQSAMHDRGAE